MHTTPPLCVRVLAYAAGNALTPPFSNDLQRTPTSPFPRRYYSYSFGYALVFLILDSFLFLGAAWYLDRVWPHALGQVSFLLCTVTFYANLAHNLTRSP